MSAIFALRVTAGCSSGSGFLPGIEHSVFQWNFAPKWFRNGGREFTLVFSGNSSNDSWNIVDGAFTTQ